MQPEKSLLLDKGIILPSGEINENKINLISGAMTAPLLETLLTFSGNEPGAMSRLSDFLTSLYNEGRQTDILAVLRILHDVSGLQFPEDVELLAGHTEARRYFLFSFMLDLDDVLSGIRLNDAEK